MNKASSIIRTTIICVIIILVWSNSVVGLAQSSVNTQVEPSIIQESNGTIEKPDTLKQEITPRAGDDFQLTAVQDSIDASNKDKLNELNKKTKALEPVTATKGINTSTWKPNSTKATWFAIVFPGGGQIYNRKYWKLPILYGGFAGCAYALTWNNTMYKDYAQAYRDLKDNNPNTNSYLELLPPNATIDPSRLESLLKNRKDRFRRYRDLSIISFVAVYALSIIDAYVDAELSNFDISKDLSLKIEPIIFKSDNSSRSFNNNNVGIQCKLTF